MPNENINIKLPISGSDVELKSFITAREKREIRSVLLGAADFDIAGKSVSAIKPETINQAEDKTFELIVVSVNGNKESILETIMNLHSQDYEFLLIEVNKITEGLALKKNP